MDLVDGEFGARAEFGGLARAVGRFEEGVGVAIEHLEGGVALEFLFDAFLEFDEGHLEDLHGLDHPRGQLHVLAEFHVLGGLEPHGILPVSLRAVLLKRSLQSPSSCYGIGQHGLVGVLQRCSHRQTSCQPRHNQFGFSRFSARRGEGVEFLGEKDRGSIALEGWVESENNFADGRATGVVGWVFDAIEEIVDGEVAGADAFEGVESAEEDVVDALKSGGFFEGNEVFGLLDDEDESAVAGGILADGARLGLR